MLEVSRHQRWTFRGEKGAAATPLNIFAAELVNKKSQLSVKFKESSFSFFFHLIVNPKMWSYSFRQVHSTPV